MKYTFVCDPDNCDTLIEVTCASGFDFPNGEIKLICPCGRQMSYISATIQPTTSERNKMEETTFDWEQSSKSWQQKAENFESLFESYRDRYNGLQSTINKIIDNLTEDYWYNPNTETNDVLSELCEIIGHTPKKEISFTAVMHFSGRIDIDLADIEDFDLAEALADTYVDIHNGDIIIDDYELTEAEEC